MILETDLWVSYGIAIVMWFGANYYGKHYMDTDDENLRPIFQRLKQRFYGRLFVNSVALVVMTFAIPRVVFVQVPDHWNAGPVAFVGYLVMAAIAIGIGPIAGHWLAHGEVRGVEK